MSLYEIGTIRELYGHDWIDLRDRVINGLKSEKTPYYILFVSQTLGKVTNTTAVAPLRQLPTSQDKRLMGMFATILLRVDNRTGQVDLVWSLPRDIPLDQAWIQYDAIVESVAAQAWEGGMPVINAADTYYIHAVPRRDS